MKNKTIFLPKWLINTQISQLPGSNTVGAFNVEKAINEDIGWSPLLPQSLKQAKKKLFYQIGP